MGSRKTEYKQQRNDKVLAYICTSRQNDGRDKFIVIFEDLKEKQPAKMQNMLRMIGYGENLGSGFPMILNAWKQAGWGEPELKNRLEVDEVALVLSIQRF